MLGLTRTLLGAGVLVVLGFGLGLVVGIVWEDPSLVAGYVAGRTESVLLEPVPGAGGEPTGVESARAAPAEPSEVAPPVQPEPAEPAPAAPREPPPGAAARPKPGAAPRATASAAGAAAFWIQVGSFTEAPQAERLRDDLHGKGFGARVATGDVGDVPHWRVRVGPLASRDEADRLAARIKREERLPTWVLSEARN